MEIRLEPGNAYVEWVCFTCGSPMQLRSANVAAYDGEKRLGFLCVGCLGLGLAHLSERMQDYAARMREEAFQLDVHSSHLPLGMPTIADLERAMITEGDQQEAAWDEAVAKHGEPHPDDPSWVFPEMLTNKEEPTDDDRSIL